MDPSWSSLEVVQFTRTTVPLSKNLSVPAPPATKHHREAVQGKDRN